MSPKVEADNRVDRQSRKNIVVNVLLIHKVRGCFKIFHLNSKDKEIDHGRD